MLFFTKNVGVYKYGVGAFTKHLLVDIYKLLSCTVGPLVLLSIGLDDMRRAAGHDARCSVAGRSSTRRDAVAIVVEKYVYEHLLIVCPRVS